MYSASQGTKLVFRRLLFVGVAACFAAVACSDIRPAPDDEGGGVLESPTHEQDTLHEEEQHQEEGGHR